MLSYQFAFEKLEVWQLSKRIGIEIYNKTRSFPSEEKFGIVSQLRRAVFSVSANLAEGSSRASGKDQAHFTTMAYSSLMETLNHLIISFDLDYINETELNNYRIQIQKLSVKLTNLKNTQLKRTKK
jgi:four helix bundle protein